MNSYHSSELLSLLTCTLQVRNYESPLYGTTIFLGAGPPNEQLPFCTNY